MSIVIFGEPKGLWTPFLDPVNRYTPTHVILLGNCLDDPITTTLERLSESGIDTRGSPRRRI